AAMLKRTVLVDGCPARMTTPRRREGGATAGVRRSQACQATAERADEATTSPCARGTRPAKATRRRALAPRHVTGSLADVGERGLNVDRSSKWPRVQVPPPLRAHAKSALARQA